MSETVDRRDRRPGFSHWGGMLAASRLLPQTILLTFERTRQGKEGRRIEEESLNQTLENLRKAMDAIIDVIAVADVVEAIASHRPYRPAKGIAAALAEIEQGRGILYDPAAVDACLKLFRTDRYALEG